jgi:hypothetical protein
MWRRTNTICISTDHLHSLPRRLQPLTLVLVTIASFVLVIRPTSPPSVASPSLLLRQLVDPCRQGGGFPEAPCIQLAPGTAPVPQNLMLVLYVAIAAVASAASSLAAIASSVNLRHWRSIPWSGICERVWIAVPIPLTPIHPSSISPPSASVSSPLLPVSSSPRCCLLPLLTFLQ